MDFNQLMVVDDGELSAEQSAFRLCHNEIMYNGSLHANYAILMAKKLKEMKDYKLYEAAGFASFEEYTEDAVGMKARQAYNYIKIYQDLPHDFLQSNAKLGISKLALLAGVSADDRQGIIDENDVDGMTVKELQEALKAKEARIEQLELDLGEALISGANERVVEDESGALIVSYDEFAAVQNKKIEADNKLLELEVSMGHEIKKRVSAGISEEIAKYNEDVRLAREEAEKYKQELKEVLSKPDKEVVKEVIKEVVKEVDNPELVKKLEEEAERAADLEADLKARKQELEAERAKLAEAEKKSKLSDPSTASFKAKFEMLQDILRAMKADIATVGGEQAEKYKNAIRAAVREVVL